MNLPAPRRRRFLLPAALAATLVVGVAPSAYADPSEGDMAQARELLQEGLKLRAAGDAEGALTRLKAAHGLVRTPITAVELARTYLKLGMLVEARETYLSVARIPVRVEETDRSRAARSESATQAEALVARIPKLRIKITGVPTDAVALVIDGDAVPTEALEAPRLVNPGAHTISARSTTGGTAETRVDLKEGETKDVELRIVLTGGTASGAGVTAPGHAPGGAAPTMATHPVDAGAPDATPRSHAVAWSLIGAGAAVGIAGGVLMGVAAAQSKSANDDGDRRASDAAKTLWTAGLATAVVGGVAFLSGGVVFLVQPKGGGHASGPSLWLNASADRVSLAGTW